MSAEPGRFAADRARGKVTAGEGRKERFPAPPAAMRPDDDPNDKKERFGNSEAFSSPWLFLEFGHIEAGVTPCQGNNSLES